MQTPILPIESIHERDVDIILLEELSTDNAFCDWFINELNLPSLALVNGAWRSISDFGLGETDILFSYESKNRIIYVLIENKLDASFQDEQYNRYVKRAEKYKQNKNCNEAYCVLVAPKLYCENQNDFEDYITYESITKRLEFTGTKRNLFKSELLKIASEKLRRGYHPINSESVQNFWLSYWKYKEKKHPSLQMKKPDIVPQNSDWPMLYDKELSSVTLYHKLGQGNTDATFRNVSEEMEFIIKENIPEWASFEKHRKSFSIRVYSGKIDRKKEFNEQIDVVENGLKNLERLRDWIKNDKKLATTG